MNSFLGLYKYLIKDFNSQSYIDMTARCVVIDETDKSYKIRLLVDTDRKRVGQELWVKKCNIIARGYRRYGTKFCEKYNTEMTDVFCRSCSHVCLNKNDLLKKF